MYIRLLNELVSLRANMVDYDLCLVLAYAVEEWVCSVLFVWNKFKHSEYTTDSAFLVYSHEWTTFLRLIHQTFCITQMNKTKTKRFKHSCTKVCRHIH